MGRIDAEITSFFDGLVSHPSWVRVYIVIAHEAATAVPELQAAIHQQNVGFRNRVESALREGIDLGEIPSGLDTGAVSIAVMAMVQSWKSPGSRVYCSTSAMNVRMRSVAAGGCGSL